MSTARITQAKNSPPSTSLSNSGSLQRKCAYADKETLNYPLQAKLKIGEANDSYEQEADRVADDVMHIAGAGAAQSANGIQPKYSYVGQSPLAPGAGEPLRSASDRRVASAASWDFSKIPVLPAPSRPAAVVQKKLVVGSAVDPLEREADAMADRVMRMSDSSSMQAKVLAASDSTGSVRRSATIASSPTMAPPLVHEALRSSGTPLDAATRNFMESRFNHDFSRVRVHADATAAESARQVNARAYTIGSRIVFGGGQYAPATITGRRLLAHELAHTVQQEHAGGGLLQRAEVDDAPSHCKGLTDIESDIDARVNSELEAARKAAPSGFDKDPKKRRAFLVDVMLRLETIEKWLWDHPQGREPSDLSGTKYRGAETLSPGPRRLAAVVNVGGLCVGSDKFGHFFVDGWSAFKAADDEAAKKASIDDEIGSQQGLGATGVFSNADIKANLAGRKFYRLLDNDPKLAFAVNDFIQNEWNELNNPSYYTKEIGKVVWKNVLSRVSWTGFITFPEDHKMAIEVNFTNVDMSKSTVQGTYQETSIPDGSDPSNQTLVKTGKFWGDLKLSSTHLEGANEKADAISGLSLVNITLDMDQGPQRTGSLSSIGESKLSGTWSEDESRGENQNGTWFLAR